MEKKYFLLEHRDDSRIVVIFRIVLGILCLAIAAYWAIFNLKAGDANAGLWVTIIFLSAFGLYQIMWGLGKTVKYIEIARDFIKLKNNTFFPRVELKASDIQKIEIFPLSLCFYSAVKGKIILRFGITFTDVINPVKDAITDFAEANNIACEEMKEEL